VNDRKNVVVGLFVLAGLVILGTLVIWFEGVGVLIRGGYTVRGHLPSAVGIRPGKRVHRDGIEVGDVRYAQTSQPDREGVWVAMRINPGEQIPREAVFVAQQSTIGDLFLDFQTTAKPTGYLPADGTAEVQGIIKAPAFLPEDVMSDFRDAMNKFQKLDQILANVQELTEPRTLKDVEAGKRRNLSTALEQFEVTAKAVQQQVEKPSGAIGDLLKTAREAAEDLRKSLAKANDAVDTLNQTGKAFQETGKKVDGFIGKADAFMAKLSKDVDHAKTVLDNANGLVTDLRAGKGTLGKLVSDDELHRALVTLTEDLRAAAKTLDRTFTFWREESIWKKEGKTERQ